MVYLIFSIFCSVLVGVIFKISRQYNNVNSFQIVWFNYMIALLFSYVVFEPQLDLITNEAPLSVYTALGILLPLVFVFLFQSIKKIGIVKTDAAQRLSLFIPILAAWLWFGENFTPLRVLGIVLGFVALFFILIKSEKASEINYKYPVGVFLGYGIIDILFKRVATFTQIPYATSLFMVFCVAFVVMALVVAYRFWFKMENFSIKNVFFGAIIGVLNFGNIWFYLNAHKVFSENPSTVFAGMNMGVIFIGTLVGVIAFKEKLSRLNYIGLFLALMAIVVIVFSQK